MSRSTWLPLFVATVDDKPAGALRHVAPDEQDADGEDRAEAEGQPRAQRRNRRCWRRGAGRRAATSTTAPTQYELFMATSTAW